MGLPELRFSDGRAAALGITTATTTATTYASYAAGIGIWPRLDISIV
jgi:hypothetical protein